MRWSIVRVASQIGNYFTYKSAKEERVYIKIYSRKFDI